MTKIPNTQQVKTITMRPKASTKCEIGGDWYTNDLEILFYPKWYYPDYMEVQKWIMDNIDGRTMNIEDVCYEIFNMLKTEFTPSGCIIINHVHNCKTHFDVDVTCGEYFNETEGD